jgi:gamma-glutamyltranspeptidase/glutathione hydrolase
MVSSAHPLATQAGLDILATGGNAFDAAVATAATLSVVEPMMSSLGGYGTIMLYDAPAGEVWFLNSSGRIPAAVDSDAFRPPTPGYLENRRGAKAVSTPGNLNAWAAMSKKYGKLDCRRQSWRRLFDAAILAADEGFVISETTARYIQSEFASFPEHAKRIYGRNGEPLQAGERLIQRDLANSLTLIAEQGAKVFYEGELGQAIDAAMRESGGFMSLDDLRQDRAGWWKPISIDCRGYTIVTASPPANSFDMLVRVGMMSQFDLESLGHNSTAYLQRYAEVTQHGFGVRLRYAGDPDISPPPLDMLLSEKYWKDQVAQIDLERAKPFEPPQISPASHTTHFVVADRRGNIVSATQTVGGFFGSKVMPQGTGIWLNNSLEYCTFEPKGNPMDAFPGRHKLSGDCPTLIMRDGKPWVAIGTPGGHTIGQTVPQMLLNMLYFQMDVQQAIAAARISFIEPDVIAVEDGIVESVRRELAAMGHNVRVENRLGNAHGLTIEYDANGKPFQFTGGSDPRGEGAAMGY